MEVRKTGKRETEKGESYLLPSLYVQELLLSSWGKSEKKTKKIKSDIKVIR